MLYGIIAGKMAIMVSKVAIVILDSKFIPTLKTVKVIKYQFTKLVFTIALDT